MHKAASQVVEDFFGQYRLRRYQKGQVLLLSGDDAHYVFYLVKGRVKQYDVSYRGDEVVVNIFKPHAFFPMSLAINKKPNQYIYEAETDIELHQAPAEEVVALLKNNPEVTFDLLSRVYSGMDGVLERMVHLMKSTARERLMFEILMDCKRFGEQQSNGLFSSSITETELATRAGLSRETVSREMQGLVKNGLVSLKGGKLTILDLPAFESNSIQSRSST